MQAEWEEDPWLTPPRPRAPAPRVRPSAATGGVRARGRTALFVGADDPHARRARRVPAASSSSRRPSPTRRSGSRSRTGSAPRTSRRCSRTPTSVASFARTVAYALVVASVSVVLGVVDRRRPRACDAVGLRRAHAPAAPADHPARGRRHAVEAHLQPRRRTARRPARLLARRLTASRRSRRPAWALPAIGLADVWQWTPLIVLLVYAALLAQDPVGARGRSARRRPRPAALPPHHLAGDRRAPSIAALFIRLVHRVQGLRPRLRDDLGRTRSGLDHDHVLPHLAGRAARSSTSAAPPRSPSSSPSSSPS